MDKRELFRSVTGRDIEASPVLSGYVSHFRNLAVMAYGEELGRKILDLMQRSPDDLDLCVQSLARIARNNAVDIAATALAKSGIVTNDTWRDIIDVIRAATRIGPGELEQVRLIERGE